MKHKTFWILFAMALALGLLAISGCDVLGGRPQPTATPTKTPWVMVVTATFTPAPTPPPAPTLEPSSTPEPTATPEPSATPAPTRKPTPRPTKKPQPTAVPQPTAGPTWQYRGEVVKWEPNCGSIGIYGHVRNMDGSGRKFVVVKICGEGGGWCTEYNVAQGRMHPFTGTRADDLGWYDCLLGDDKLAIETKSSPRSYYAVIIDSQGNESEISARVSIGPFTCESHGWAVVDWQRLIP